MADRLRISGGRVIDPASGVDSELDVLIADGRIAELGRPGKFGAGEEVIDARGCVVTPGFVDLHCHLGDPGREEAETLASGTAAAAAGGFTTLCCMADTLPPLDNAPSIAALRSRAGYEGRVRVLPLGAVTRGREGRELTEMAEMAQAGAIAFSDDPQAIASARVLRHALEYSRLTGRAIVDHAEDLELAKDGQMAEGELATILGLRGIPGEAEEIAIARDLALAKLTGAHLHLAHVTTAGGVELVRRAKRSGVRVTADVTPHHLALTEALVAGNEASLMLRQAQDERRRRDQGELGHGGSGGDRARCYNTLAKVSPPLRTASDAAALRAGLRDGTIDAIATDHTPRRLVDKECEFGLAKPGIAGLETALRLVLRVVGEGDLSLGQAVAALTVGPARVFGLPYGTLCPGASADVVVFDPEASRMVEVARLQSKARNNPVDGHTLRGRVLVTIVGGRVAFEEEASLLTPVLSEEERELSRTETRE